MSDRRQRGRPTIGQGLGIARRYDATVHAPSVLDDGEIGRRRYPS